MGSLPCEQPLFDIVCSTEPEWRSIYTDAGRELVRTRITQRSGERFNIVEQLGIAAIDPESNVLGICSVYLTVSRHRIQAPAFMSFIAVSKSAEHTGIAQALVKTAEWAAQSEGFRAISALTTRPTAKRLLAKRDYRPAGNDMFTKILRSSQPEK